MMMRIFLYALVIGFATLSAQAQKENQPYQLLEGEVGRIGRNTHVSDIIATSQETYLLKEKGKKAILEKYGASMNLLGRNELDLKEGEKQKKLEFLVSFGERLCLFTSFRNAQFKTNYLFMQTVNRETLEPNSDLRSVCEIPFLAKFNDGGFGYNISGDSTKLVVYYDLPFQKGEAERFGYLVLDRGLNVLSKREVTMPYDDELVVIKNYQLSNEGELFLSALLYNEKPQPKRGGKVNYKYLIISYRPNTDDANQYIVDLEGKFITDLQFLIAESALICGGLYSEEGIDGVKGTFYMSLDPATNKVKHATFKEFPADFLQQFMSPKKVKKGKELYKYDLRELLWQKDGSVLMLAEQYYISTTTSPVSDGRGGYTYRSTYSYHYNDIIAVHVTALGQIDWTTKIPKTQISRNDRGRYSSFVFGQDVNKTYLLFNDNPKNMEAATGKKTANLIRNKKTVLVMVTLDSEGGLSKQVVLNAGTFKVLPRPKVSRQLIQGEVLLFGQKGRRQRLAKILLNN